GLVLPGPVLPRPRVDGLRGRLLQGLLQVAAQHPQLGVLRPQLLQLVAVVAPGGAGGRPARAALGEPVAPGAVGGGGRRSHNPCLPWVAGAPWERKGAGETAGSGGHATIARKTAAGGQKGGVRAPSRPPGADATGLAGGVRFTPAPPPALAP